MRRAGFLPKALAVMLCVALVGVTAGCGNTNQTSETSAAATTAAPAVQETKADTLTEAQSEAPAAEVAADDDPYGKYSEPITLSVLRVDTASNNGYKWDSTNPDRKSPTENVWVNAYKDYLNIELDQTIAEDGTAMNALINTGMASGDLPDVIIVSSKEMFFTMIANGVLQDIRPAYEEYIATKGRMVKEMVDSMPGCLECVTVDGQMLGFPIIPTAYSNSELLWIRQDWLDKLGLEAPKTIDEFLDVARAFKEAQLGGDGTLGLGLGGATDVLANYKCLMAPYGVVYNTWSPNSEGKYEYSMVSDKMKGALELMQQLYSEGLVRSDFITTDTLTEEVANGKVGMVFGAGWLGATSIGQSYANDETAEWIPVPIPTLDGEPVEQWTNATVGSFIVVTSGCEHPEAIFKMLELEKHMYYEPEGDEMTRYNVAEDGNGLWNMMVFRNVQRGDFNLLRGELIREAVANDTPLEEIDIQAQGAYDQVLKGLAGDRSMRGYPDVYLKGYKILSEELEAGLLKAEYPGPSTDNFALYMGTLDSYLTAEFAKIVMGDDVSNWDAAIEYWYKNGGQAITDDVNAYYSGQ